MFIDSNDPGIERRPRRNRIATERRLGMQPKAVRGRALEIWNTPIRRGVYPTLDQAVDQAIAEAKS